MPNEKISLSYKDAGVDIETADAFVSSVKSLVKKTHRPGVLGGIGGFGALFEIPAGYQKPVLVSGTDGVGTKLKLAVKTGKHATIGIDLVAMCANDILTLGAEPLFFLDYYATGKLSLEHAKTILQGISDGCELAQAALIGGETAEMPGVYHGEDYDLAGFCVGVVEKEKIIDGRRIAPGNVMLALASSGPHSNGYSLVRKILEHHSLNGTLAGKPLADILMEPTRIYVKSILALKEQLDILGLVHITGGGLLENIPRILPDHMAAQLDLTSWTWPPIFQWLQEKGGIEHTEMHRTFNLGVGMVVIVAKADATRAITALTALGETVWPLGVITQHKDRAPAVVLSPC